MKATIMGCFVAFAALQALPTIAAEPTTHTAPDLSAGKALFHEKCAMCHGKVGMGTGLLARRVQPAELAQRDDLIAAYVITAARMGVGNMPPIPRGEASDAQLKAIADYLTAPKAERP
jgi:mono/diheme cytochrome c family protein